MWLHTRTGNYSYNTLKEKNARTGGDSPLRIYFYQKNARVASHFMKKETFIFYKDWANVLNDLPDTIQLEIYQAITAYAFGTTPKELSPLASVAFAFIKQTIDRDIEKYLSVSQARSQAGKKGGRPLKNKNLQEDKKPLPKKANPSTPKDTPQESSRIKEERLAQGKENFSAKEEEKAFFSGDNAVPQDRESTATGGFTPPTIAEIEAYCRERGNGISGALFYEFYSARDWQMGSQPMKNWKAAVHSWEQREAQEAQKRPKNWKSSAFQAGYASAGGNGNFTRQNARHEPYVCGRQTASDILANLQGW